MSYTLILLLFGIGILVESFDCRQTLNATYYMYAGSRKVTGQYDLCAYQLTSQGQFSYYEALDKRSHGNVEGGDVMNYTFYFNIANNIIHPTGLNECDTNNETFRQLHHLPLGYCKNIVNGSCIDPDRNIVPITALTAAYQVKKGESKNCWRLHDGVTEPIWTFLDTNDPALGIQMKYINGDWCAAAGKNREFIIKFKCADNTQNVPTKTQTVYEPIDDICSYEIVIETTRGCPLQCTTIDYKICDGNGICEYDWSLGEPRCFCYCGLSGSGCDEAINEDCNAKYNITETGGCSMDGCTSECVLMDTNGIKAQYDLVYFDLPKDVFTIKDTLNPHFEYMFNICESMDNAAVPRDCFQLQTHGPCIETAMIGNQLVCDRYQDTTGRVPSAVQIETFGNESSCYWLGMEVDQVDNMEQYKVELLDVDDAGRGVIYTILNGEWCPSVGRNRELRIILQCPDDNRIEFEPAAHSTQIQFEQVEEIDTCIYELSYSSPLACPNNCISRLNDVMFDVCATHGICAADPIAGAIRCLCDDGFSGTMCEIDEALQPTEVPSNEPTVSSTKPPLATSYDSTTSIPTRSPLNQYQTQAPKATTPIPTKSPLNQGESHAPTTSMPSKAPKATTSMPSKSPFNQGQSQAPTTSMPSKSPLNQGESHASTTSIPTRSPVKTTNINDDIDMTETLEIQSKKSDTTPKGDDGHMVYILILVAVIVVLIGVIGFCFYQNKKNKKMMEDFVLIADDQNKRKQTTNP